MMIPGTTIKTYENEYQQCQEAFSILVNENIRLIREVSRKNEALNEVRKCAESLRTGDATNAALVQKIIHVAEIVLDKPQEEQNEHRD
jgi:hypothetical protein